MHVISSAMSEIIDMRGRGEVVEICSGGREHHSTVWWVGRQ